MSPEDLEKVKAQLAKKPKMPDLTRKPETTRKIARLWQALPPDRKAILARVMRTPCALCQGEFKLPSVGRSHGMCNRHVAQQYIDMGMKPPPPSEKNNALDMGTLSPYERKLLKFVFAIAHREEDRAKKYKAFDPSIEEVN